MDDPFAALGLARRFDLSEAEVQRAWLALAAAAHPDRAGADADEGEAARAAARLNDARLTLLDPERRADALVTLLGGPTREQEKGLSPEFLLEIMEVRQELDRAMEHGDAAELKRLRAWADARRSGHIERVGALFGRMGGAPDAATLREIRLALNEWRYIERMLEQSGEV